MSDERDAWGTLIGMLVAFTLGLGATCTALALIVFAVRCAWRAGA